MSTLSQQIEELQSQLYLSQQSEASQQIIKEYTEIYNHLAPPYSTLQKTIKKFKAIENIPESAATKPYVSDAVKLLAGVTLDAVKSFSVRWETELQQARQGDDLIKVENTLTGLVKKFNDEINDCWEQWIKQLESTIGLEKILLETQKFIPGKELIYSEYVEKNSLFHEYSKYVPEDGSVIKDIEQLSKKMAELIGKMEFNLPDEVASFFKYLNNPNNAGKVPLNMLTKEVIEWVAEHNLMGQFVVERLNRRF